jgi:hypothetical protein
MFDMESSGTLRVDVWKSGPRGGAALLRAKRDAHLSSI